MSYGKPVTVLDLRGGYNDRDPYELVKGNELIAAENAQWREGLEQRGGHRIYATGLAAGDVIRGVSPRFYANGNWTTILAVDENVAGKVRFWSLVGTTLTRLSTTVEFTADYQVIMEEAGSKVVAVNGQDDTLVIYYDSGWQLVTLDEYDTRERAAAYWTAGQYDAGETDYVDDTEDAQDEDADDFQLASTDAGDGFFIGCDHTFNKVVLASASQAGGAPVAVYEYYADDETWKSCTMVQTPTWTDVAGTRTIEFDYPLDMGRWGGEESYLANKFLFRVRFTTAPAAAVHCDSAAVYHSQWITQITEDTKPHFIVAHNDRMWLMVGYLAYWCPPNDVSGWRGQSEAEYFLVGGPKVLSAVSFKKRLVVFKDNALYAFYGNTTDTFDREKEYDVGLKAILTPVATEDGECVFLAPGGVFMYDGNRCVCCSDHLLDFRSWTWTDAVATKYQGEWWCAFPTDQKVLTVDPASLVIDPDTGVGRAAFFKFSGIQIDYWINCGGKDDSGYLLAAVNASTPYVARLDNGTTDEFAAGVNTAIDFQAQVPYKASGGVATHKAYGAVVVKLKKASAQTKYALTFSADEGARSQSTNVVVPAGSGYYEKQWMRLPYQVDGRNLSLLVRNNQATDAGFRGLTYEYKKKRL